MVQRAFLKYHLQSLGSIPPEAPRHGGIVFHLHNGIAKGWMLLQIVKPDTATARGLSCSKERVKRVVPSCRATIRVQSMQGKVKVSSGRCVGGRSWYKESSWRSTLSPVSIPAKSSIINIHRNKLKLRPRSNSIDHNVSMVRSLLTSLIT